LLRKQVILIIIPLLLASFTHLFNSAGFNTFQTDEGHYMRKALVVLKGISLQDEPGMWDAYHAPFFGQILLGTLLLLSGFPNFVMAQTIPSIELAIAFPRMLMGIFAIIDTLLVFKISQQVGNNKVALFASSLFAVTPMTLMIRFITLDAIALPFLLTSILISLYAVTWNKNVNSDRHILLVLLSGTCLGLAILTKLPLITMIPLVSYLIYKNSKRRIGVSPLKMIFIWFLPILIIPSIWPIYAVYVGEYDMWEKQVVEQVERERKPILETFFGIDLMLFVLGMGGLIYSLIKRDWVLIVWITPFLIFVYIHGWFLPYHWAIVFPAFCIATAKFVVELIQKMNIEKIRKTQTIVIICSIIISIGFFNTLILVSRNFESHAIQGIVDSLDYLDISDGEDDDKINEKITVIAPTAYSWMYKYIHKLNYTFPTDLDVGQEIETKKTIILQDRSIGNRFKNLLPLLSSFVFDLGTAKKICNLDIEWYRPVPKIRLPITVALFENLGTSNNIIKINSSSEGTNPQRLEMKNTTARFVNITVAQNSSEKTRVISDIVINGKDRITDECKKIPIYNIIYYDNRDNRSYIFPYSGFDTIASYQKLTHDLKKISKYQAKLDNLNGFTKLFSPIENNPRTLELNANYKN
jgi:hypothetical protein